MADKSSKEVNTAMIDMDKMRIGDKFRAPIYPSVRERKLEEGTIVYIHTEKRFFTVEFMVALYYPYWYIDNYKRHIYH